MFPHQNSQSATFQMNAWNIETQPIRKVDSACTRLKSSNALAQKKLFRTIMINPDGTFFFFLEYLEPNQEDGENLRDILNEEYKLG